MQSISVIIPTWNRAASLEIAIKSALNQTLPPLEILVCDDGSTDESREIVTSINDSRVKWIDGSHSGKPSVPRNKGIQESKGEWLAFLDDDDEWLPEKLERQLACAIKTGCDAACSNIIRYTSSKENGRPFFAIKNGSKISFQKILRKNVISCSSALIKKNVVIKSGGFPEEKDLIAVEDYAFWLRVLTFTDFAYVGEPLLYYRDMPELSVRKSSLEWPNNRIPSLKAFISWAKNRKIEKINKRYIYAVNIYLIWINIKYRIAKLKRKLVGFLQKPI